MRLTKISFLIVFCLLLVQIAIAFEVDKTVCTKNDIFYDCIIQGEEYRVRAVYKVIPKIGTYSLESIDLHYDYMSLDSINYSSSRTIENANFTILELQPTSPEKIFTYFFIIPNFPDSSLEKLTLYYTINKKWDLTGEEPVLFRYQKSWYKMFTRQKDIGIVDVDYYSTTSELGMFAFARKDTRDEYFLSKDIINELPLEYVQLIEPIPKPRPKRPVVESPTQFRKNNILNNSSTSSEDSKNKQNVLIPPDNAVVATDTLIQPLEVEASDSIASINDILPESNFDNQQIDDQSMSKEERKTLIIFAIILIGLAVLVTFFIVKLRIHMLIPGLRTVFVYVEMHRKIKEAHKVLGINKGAATSIYGEISKGYSSLPGFLKKKMARKGLDLHQKLAEITAEEKSAKDNPKESPGKPDTPPEEKTAKPADAK